MNQVEKAEQEIETYQLEYTNENGQEHSHELNQEPGHENNDEQIPEHGNGHINEPNHDDQKDCTNSKIF